MEKTLWLLLICYEMVWMRVAWRIRWGVVCLSSTDRTDKFSKDVVSELPCWNEYWRGRERKKR